MNKFSGIKRPDFNPEKEKPHREFYGFEDFDKLFVVNEKGELYNKITRQGAIKNDLVGNKRVDFFCFSRVWKTKDVVWLLRYKVWPIKRLVHINGDIHDNSEKNLVEDVPLKHENLDRIEFDRKMGYWRVRVFPKSRQNRNKPVYFFHLLEEAVTFRDKNAVEFEPKV